MQYSLSNWVCMSHLLRSKIELLTKFHYFWHKKRLKATPRLVSGYSTCYSLGPSGRHDFYESFHLIKKILNAVLFECWIIEYYISSSVLGHSCPFWSPCKLCREVGSSSCHTLGRFLDPILAIPEGCAWTGGGSGVVGRVSYPGRTGILHLWDTAA